MRHRVRALRVLFACTALLAGWAASAAAGGLLPPSLPALPKAPVKVPTLPLLPQPKVPETPVVVHAPRPLPQSIPSSVTPSSGGHAAAAPHASTPSRPWSSRASRIYRLRLARDWIARRGPARRRQTVLTFVLSRPTLVEFVVLQIAPDCRQVGRFRVQGRRGLNRVRFRGRLGRRMLGPGTYRIRARTRRGTRIVDTRLVVVRSASREEIASARGADACAATTGRSAALLPPGGRTGRHRAAATRSKTTPAATRPQQKSTVHPHGVLGAHFTRIVEAVKSIPPILFAVVGLAILLLGIASLPLSVAPGGRAAAALAHRRGVIAFAGATALAAAMLAYALH